MLFILRVDVGLCADCRSKKRDFAVTETIPNQSSGAVLVPQTCRNSFSEPILQMLLGLQHFFRDLKDIMHTFAPLQTEVCRMLRYSAGWGA